MSAEEPVYHYEWKPKPELLFAILVAVLTVLMQLLVEFDPEAISDWQTWAVGIGAACVRAAAGAFLAYIAKEGIVYDADVRDKA